MSDQKPKTLRELKKLVSRLPSVKEELRLNLMKKLESNEPLFPKVIGYEDTVIPGIINAILCGHNMILLGERGQGKSRIIRQMVDLLDEWLPVVEGCPINDDPFSPICSECKSKKEEMGDDLPVAHIHRDKRLIEKLATSDVSTADLIGEVDPIKIAQGRTLEDEDAIHFGLVPRGHRSIFAINELPDLAEKIQVAFFNIMEENDFQIKGFPVRLPLDIFIVATANPEDYTNRGRIITPLKDRFDVQLRTHYPRTKEYEIAIMDQEIRRFGLDDYTTVVPQFIKEFIVEMTFQARESPDINQHSGVSCRVSIRSYESILGSALRRCLKLGEKMVVPRITDIESIFPAIAGKIEMEFEVSEGKDEEILEDLANRSIKTIFDKYYDLEELSTITQAFQEGMKVTISHTQPSSVYMGGYDKIPGLKEAVGKLVDPDNPAEASAAIEFIFEGLHLSNKINRDVDNKGLVYS